MVTAPQCGGSIAPSFQSVLCTAAKCTATEHTAPEINKKRLCTGKAHCRQGGQLACRRWVRPALANPVWHPPPPLLCQTFVYDECGPSTNTTTEAHHATHSQGPTNGPALPVHPLVPVSCRRVVAEDATFEATKLTCARPCTAETPLAHQTCPRQSRKHMNVHAPICIETAYLRLACIRGSEGVSIACHAEA